MRFIAAFIVAVTLPLSFAVPAEATRPIPGFDYKDECKNIKGEQPIYMLVGTGPYRFDLSTKRPNDCRFSRWR